MANDTTWDPKEFVPATKKGKNGEGKPAFFAAALKSSEDSRPIYVGITAFQTKADALGAAKVYIKYYNAGGNELISKIQDYIKSKTTSGQYRP